MRWIKKGLIIKPRPDLGWMVTHAMVPFAEKVTGDLFRVYFSGRDALNRSLIGYAQINIQRPKEVLYITKKPILGLGELGCFDDNGVTPSWIVTHGGKKYLYYIGWNKCLTVRMGLVTGLAVSTDKGKTFKRFSRAPLLERTDKEPFSILTGPCVLKEGGLWRMWYVSAVGWVHRDLPRYNIKYAESKEGLVWKRKGIVCIDFASKDEAALARPCVLKEDEIYKMWYSYKGERYRIGYAESKDGIAWKRKDDLAGLDVSKDGWDSEMVEYAFVFNHKKDTYMLYNGNDYGKGGIGLAVLSKT